MTVLFFYALWALPVIVAYGRGVFPRRLMAILLLTFFLSWTIIGWVFALLWAVDSPAQRSCEC